MSAVFISSALTVLGDRNTAQSDKVLFLQFPNVHFWNLACPTR